MGLILCEQCGYNVSTEATHCPHCNTPVELFKLKDALSRKKEESRIVSKKEPKKTEKESEFDEEEKPEIKSVGKTSPNIFDTIKSFKENNVSTDTNLQKADKEIKHKKSVFFNKKLDEPPTPLKKEKIDEPEKTKKVTEDKSESNIRTEFDKKPRIVQPTKSITKQVRDEKPTYKTLTQPTTDIHTEPIEKKSPLKSIKSDSPALKYILIIGAVILIAAAGFMFLNKSGNSNVVEKEQQEKLEHFNKNRQKIIDDINAQLHKNNFGNAQKIAREYLYINDPEINKMYVKARKEYLMIELSKLTKKWDNFVLPGSIPLGDKEIKRYLDIKQLYREKRRIYDELIKIDPQNAGYKEKFQYFSNKYDDIDKKFKELNKKRVEAKKRQETIDKQFDRIEGSHINLEKRIKSNMKYPDSFIHIKSAYDDKGSYLIVSTTYQGKDIYGQVVIKTVKARVGLNGEVERIISEY